MNENIVIDKNHSEYLLWCSKCKLDKPNKEYSFSTKQYCVRSYLSICKICRSKANSEWGKLNRDKANINNKKYIDKFSKEQKFEVYKKYTDKHYIKYMFNTLKWNAKKRNLEVCIDVEFIIDLFNKQNKKCFYTGDEMNLIQSDPNVMSVDRIDSSIGYSVDNCVSCCTICNMMKNILSVEDFLKHIKKNK